MNDFSEILEIGYVRCAKKSIPFDRDRLYVTARQYFDQHYHNRLQETDFWSQGLPTLGEYGQWITKPVFATISDIFRKRRRYILIAHILRIYNSHFLRISNLDVYCLPFPAVHFLITDLTLDDPRASVRAEVKDDHAPIYLHEIAGTNLGAWRPTQLVVAPNFTMAMTDMRNSAPDLERQAVVFRPITESFVPATQARLAFIRNGFRISAKSAGSSLLLRPVQYSQCWRVSSASADTDRHAIRLYRAKTASRGCCGSAPASIPGSASIPDSLVTPAVVYKILPTLSV